MKALRIILIIVIVLVAAILIVPLFAPATAEVSAEITIDRTPEQIFPMVASFEGRDLWDPWLTQDSTAVASIDSKAGYVGSTYLWKGERIGTGRMEVISVTENEHIESSLWFGDVETPSKVTWDFEPVDGGTRAVWSFSEDTKYPIGRLGMMLGKVILKKSFDLGLSQLKETLESMPEKAAPTGLISVTTLPSMHVLLADGAGTMEEISAQLSELYGLLFQAASEQALEVIGAPFVDYLDYDEATGFSNYRAGIQVNGMGHDQGLVKAEHFPETEVVQTIHTGPYETSNITYEAIDAYIQEHGLEIAGNALEFYQVGAMNESDPSKWETLVAFPLK